MPDPERLTISASQVPALWNASPYMTRWMLWQWFKNPGAAKEQAEDTRMHWGTVLQTPVLEQAAKDLKLEIIPNETNVYLRRGNIGATRDAVVIAPDRGPGIVEVKCVFDFKQWMEKWDGGQHPPRHAEIQLQAGMYVGDGLDRYFQWGVIVAWCCGGPLTYFHRSSNVGLWTKMEVDAKEFRSSLVTNEEPEVFGTEREAQWLTAMYETEKGSVLNLTHDADMAETLKGYADNTKRMKYIGEVRDSQRTRLMAAAKGYEHVCLPDGVGYRMVRSGRGKSIKPYGVESEDGE